MMHLIPHCIIVFSSIILFALSDSIICGPHLVVEVLDKDRELRFVAQLTQTQAPLAGAPAP